MPSEVPAAGTLLQRKVMDDVAVEFMAAAATAVAVAFTQDTIGSSMDGRAEPIWVLPWRSAGVYKTEANP